MKTKIKSELNRFGILMLADPVLPSLTTTIAGQPIKGSWWGHPKGNLIFNLSQDLYDDPNLLCVKLINKKICFVKIEHWPSFFALATCRREWQLKKLSTAVSRFLKSVESKGQIRADQVRGAKAGEVGKQIAQLEERLIVYSESMHTESGSHVRAATSWKKFMKDRRIKLKKMDLEAAYAHFANLKDQMVAEIPEAKIRFAWD